MPTLPQLSVIIVSWNVREALRANLARLHELADEIPAEVFVVDNASADQSADMVRADFPWVRLIANAENRGFGAGNNQAMREARGEAVLLLNPDMLVTPGALRLAHDTVMGDRTIGVLGLRLTDEDGTTLRSVRNFPSFVDQFATLTKLAKIWPRLLDRQLAPGFDYGKSADVDQVRGSFFALRRELLETVGYFDEPNFFIWYEEVDLCKRMRNAGLRVRYLAADGARDFHGRSFAQVSLLTNQLRSTRSLVNYAWKWFPRWQAVILAALRPIIIAGAVVLAPLRLRTVKNKA
jgi:GT2 family glycosyltransferase